MFIKPIFDSPKSVSLMCPIEVINKLQEKQQHNRSNLECRHLTQIRSQE